MGKANILIIKVSAIGETVIALPHIESICSYHQGDMIWLLTGKSSRSIYVNHPRLNIAVLDRDQWIRRQGLEEKKYAVIHAGSSSDRPAKRWPLEHYLKLAKMIEANGLRCIWVGTGPEREINAFLSEKVGMDSTGKFNLCQLYEVARKALFGVGSDSCPMHIFAAAGIPVYCFFGPENWRWSYPLGQRDRVLTNAVECSPCFRGVCPKDKGHRCLTGITPEQAFNKIDQELHLLKNTSPNFFVD